MTENRRQPLGGVSKHAFTESGGHELTFDLIAGLKSDLCHEIKKIQCQPEKCDKKFIKRWSEKIPLSMPSVLGIIAGACGLVGYGALKWETVLKWIMKL